MENIKARFHAGMGSEWIALRLYPFRSIKGNRLHASIPVQEKKRL